MLFSKAVEKTNIDITKKHGSQAVQITPVSKPDVKKTILDQIMTQNDDDDYQDVYNDHNNYNNNDDDDENEDESYSVNSESEDSTHRSKKRQKKIVNPNYKQGEWTRFRLGDSDVTEHIYYEMVTHSQEKRMQGLHVDFKFNIT